MTNCNSTTLEFPRLDRRKVQAEFSGGEISGDGGVLLIEQIDRKLKLTECIDRVITDTRNKNQVIHSQLSLLRQRIYGICLGYEDLNDHSTLRNDPAIQTAVRKTSELGSQSTLCRLENRIDKQAMWDIHTIMIEQFIQSFSTNPIELILDFDATDDLVHGNQDKSFYHGYYKNYCFLPLYVFCGDHMLVSYLRPSNIDGAKHSWAILSLLVKRMRQAWPDVKIIFRGDSGFCRWKMMRWCDKNKVYYIIGLPKNSVLMSQVKEEVDTAEKYFNEKKEKYKNYQELKYGAKKWDKTRPVIAKIEHMEKGPNTRFIVTSLEGSPKDLYEKIYCARGDMENRIKEQKLGLFADRTSCHQWLPNQFRLLLSSLAYILLSALRRTCLVGTQLEKSQVNTIRLKLLKIGTVILRNTRRIRFLFTSNYPYQELFQKVVNRLLVT